MISLIQSWFCADKGTKKRKAFYNSLYSRIVRAVALVLIVVATSLGGQKAFASSAIFYSTKATLVASDQTTTNYGSNTYLHVGYVVGSWTRNSLLEFNVGTSTTGTISSVSLCVYGDSFVGGAGSFTVSEIFPQTSSWTQNGATWNTINGSTNWSTAGGNISTNVGDISFTNGTNQYNCGVVSDISAFTSSGTQDYILNAQSSDSAYGTTALNGEGMGSANPPYLIYTYTAGGGGGGSSTSSLQYIASTTVENVLIGSGILKTLGLMLPVVVLTAIIVSAIL